MSGKHVVSAGDRATAEAARELLWLGGNAFDAAVGAVFTSMVAESTLTSAAGGGCLLALPRDSEPVLFDFFVDMPSGKLSRSDLDFFSVFGDFGTAQQEFHIGKGAVAVPGNTAGLLHLQNRLGRLARRDVLAPAIQAASKGVALSERQAYLVKILGSILTYSEAGRQIYAPEGTLLQEGELIVMPEFADFLSALAAEGADLLYRGEAARILTDWNREGGLCTSQDLSSYQVFERSPLTTHFNGCQVLLNPPPAQSGVLIDLSLSLLERGRDGASRILLSEIVNAFDITNQFRREHIPFGPPEDLEWPVSETELFEDYWERFAASKIGKGKEDPFAGGSTTHLSVLDKEGNAATVTTTNGEGCGYILPKLGFMANNMLGEEDLNPRGFHQYRPRTRLSSMIAPTIVTEGGKPILLTGTAGSNRIRSVIIQLLVNYILHGLDLEAATRAPRLHLEGDILHLEPGLSGSEVETITSRYEVERWQEQNLFFGGANSVSPDQAAADLRRGGVSLTFR